MTCIKSSAVGRGRRLRTGETNAADGTDERAAPPCGERARGTLETEDINPIRLALLLRPEKLCYARATAPLPSASRNWRNQPGLVEKPILADQGGSPNAA